ncbi:hypothetical protein RF11_10402 [Thelohanellus kitauei]|uniref:MULE transposase domain-containing protein n=1 Tax=Thelohanellus kitauei TaxID=669202 RepID=A0A0C2J698_THEKT|nr:hypothetical protein RF11_10402 [Thelohanellus kitauei]
MMNVKQASISALRTVYPSSSIRGCYFHFSQCVWRKIQENSEILNQYLNDALFALNLRQLIALAFVPQTDVMLLITLKTTLSADFEQIRQGEFLSFQLKYGINMKV